MPKKLLKERRIYGNAWSETGHIMRPIAKHLTRFLHTFPEGYFPWVMILNKLVRVLAVPHHLDSWKDIAGYATLVTEYLESKENHHG